MSSQLARLERLGEQIELQVAGADHGAARWQAVEIAQEQVLCIPRAAVHIVDDLHRINPEQ